MPATSVSVAKRRRISQEMRDRIVLEHLPLVKAIAIRVHENLPVHVDLDDLIHAGVLGLFDSVVKYDSGQKRCFPGVCEAPDQGSDSRQPAADGLGVAGPAKAAEAGRESGCTGAGDETRPDAERERSWRTGWG